MKDSESMTSASELWIRLREKEYRDGYSEAQYDIEMPCRIEALRRNRGWSIEQLASASGISPDRLKDIETFEIVPSIADLQRIASAFDVGLLVKFAPFSELVRLDESFSPTTFNVTSFNEDDSPALDRTFQAVAKGSWIGRPTVIVFAPSLDTSADELWNRQKKLFSHRPPNAETASWKTPKTLLTSQCAKEPPQKWETCPPESPTVTFPPMQTSAR